MSITIKGQAAIDAAYKAMDTKEVFALFGNTYRVTSVSTLRKDISDSLWGEVELSCTTSFRELAKEQ